MTTCFWCVKRTLQYDDMPLVLHFNPAKHGLVENVKDWAHSTFHRYIREGIYPENWAANIPDDKKWKLTEHNMKMKQRYLMKGNKWCVQRTLHGDIYEFLLATE